MAKDRPQVLQGFRDLLPEQMMARQRVLSTAREVFESYGFEPLETPSLEYASVLAGKLGPEAETSFYNFHDRGGRHVALRYDLTVPLARFMASHPDLPRPFKRYQVGTVWRAERPGKNRYREFTQCDADIVGTRSPASDAETIAALITVYRRLGLTDVKVRLNHRQLLNAVAMEAGVEPSQFVLALRSIDKLDKISAEDVRNEMTGGGIRPAAAERFLDAIMSEAHFNSLGELRTRIRSEAGHGAIDELEAVAALLEATGAPVENYGLDLSLARGLDYYTGSIFEVALPGMRSSIGSGGRYDQLVGMFGEKELPTVGGSIGLDRVVDALTDRALHSREKTITQVLVCVFSPELLSESVRLASELRSAGVRTEAYLGDGNLRRQFQFADSRGIPLAAVVGPDELAQGLVGLRDLRRREQTGVRRADLLIAVAQALDGPAGISATEPVSE